MDWNDIHYQPLKPPASNASPNSSEEIQTIRVNIAADDKYTCPLIEHSKKVGLYARLCNEVRTLRRESRQTEVNGERSEPRSIGDDELANKIQDDFGFGQFNFTKIALIKSLMVYPELYKAYMSGNASLRYALEDAALERIEAGATIENIQLGMQLMDTISRIEERNIKSVNGQTVNLNVISPETTKTVQALTEGLTNIGEINFDEPDEEAIEWDRIQAENEEQGNGESTQ